MIQQRMKVERGEIWWADLNGSGSIQAGRRPVVIVSNKMNNIHSPIVNVIPITSKNKKYIPSHVEVAMDCGLSHTSTILTEQITTINKTDLLDRINRSTEKTITRLNKAIRLQLGIDEFMNTRYANWKNKINKRGIYAK